MTYIYYDTPFSFIYCFILSGVYFFYLDTYLIVAVKVSLYLCNWACKWVFKLELTQFNLNMYYMCLILISLHKASGWTSLIH